MITQLMKKTKEFSLERTYPAPIDAVWRAWTDPEALRQWWGPEHTTVPECRVDLRVGGELYLVMEAGEGMGKYAGTRWPLAGTFTEIAEPHTLVYDARSWTEGEEDKSTILHVNRVTLSESGGETTVRLHTVITKVVGVKARLASFGMKFGYKDSLANLDTYLAG